MSIPGTCRDGIPEDRRARAARAWRIRIPSDAADSIVEFRDRLQGAQAQDLARDVGDFVVKRADGLFAYQLAVVVDDAAQGVTHVVRGADLLASTPRQIFLQRMLGLADSCVPASSGRARSRRRQALEADATRRRCRTIRCRRLLAAWQFLDQPLPERQRTPRVGRGILVDAPSRPSIRRGCRRS